MFTVANTLIVLATELVTAIESASFVLSAVTAQVNKEISCVTVISVTTPTSEVVPPIFLMAPSYLLKSTFWLLSSCAIR